MWNCIRNLLGYATKKLIGLNDRSDESGKAEEIEEPKEMPVLWT